MSTRRFLYVVGAQKSATTWLRQVLLQFTNFELPPVKEIGYFNARYLAGQFDWATQHRVEQAGDALNYDVDVKIAQKFLSLPNHLNDDWYRSLFSHIDEQKYTGDFTPEYCLLEESDLRRLKVAMPNSKIIFIYRDPVDRCISHLQMKREFNISQDSIEVWEKDDFLLSRSRYELIIPKLQKVYGEDLLAIDYKNISVNPLSVVTGINSFLGLHELVEIPEEVLHTKVFKSDELYDLDQRSAWVELLRPHFEGTYSFLNSISTHSIKDSLNTL